MRRVSHLTHVDSWDFTFQSLPRRAIPIEVVKADKTYRFEGQTVEVRLLDPSHIDTGLYVCFKKANVASLGDLFWNGV